MCGCDAIARACAAPTPRREALGHRAPTALPPTVQGSTTLHHAHTQLTQLTLTTRHAPRAARHAHGALHPSAKVRTRRGVTGRPVRCARAPVCCAAPPFPPCAPAARQHATAAWPSACLRLAGAVTLEPTQTPWARWRRGAPLKSAPSLQSALPLLSMWQTSLSRHSWDSSSSASESSAPTPCQATSAAEHASKSRKRCIFGTSVSSRRCLEYGLRNPSRLALPPVCLC